ncbi:MAG: GxxExxY protein [Candidatus Roizmanbacteria bacterium]|nr:GxxExxY protein [Candidatus Roizmanbacteria bacterium]
MELLYSDVTHKIRKAAFNVYNELGFGHKENVYQKSLEEEFNQIKLIYKKEVNLTVFYKDKKVGFYRPDFIIDDKIIIEIKSAEFIPKTFETQLIYYLKSTKFKLGLLINFGASKLQIKRLIWTG